MSFDWNEYLPLAQQLSALGNDAARRSAISRAYYCAFHAASLSLAANKVLTNPRYSRDRHLQIWNIYIVSTSRDCRRIGNNGQRLKLERHSADYNADEGFPDARVQRCIAQATSIVAGIPANVPESFVPGDGLFKRAMLFVRRFV